MSYLHIRQFAQQMRQNPTQAESYFWQRVRDRRLTGKRFNRQFIIKHEEILGKKRFFIADFYCHEKRLIVEIDGDYHQKESQILYDQIREEKLRELGFEVIRFTNDQVIGDWEGVERILCEWLG